jgi:hypothetical protein
MELSFGQIIDPDNGYVMPWLTHGALDEIKSWDLSDKVIWMWGAGMGDLWLAKRCKKLYVVERLQEWIIKNLEVRAANNCANIEYIHRPCNEGSGAQDMYCEIPEGLDIDIMINDDAYRTEVCQVAVDYFKKRGGGTLICDNWIQSFVWISPKAEEIMAPFDAKIFEQPDHTDNDGINKWKTGIWNIK